MFGEVLDKISQDIKAEGQKMFMSSENLCEK